MSGCFGPHFAVEAAVQALRVLELDLRERALPPALA